jgi:hypothetical protein
MIDIPLIVYKRVGFNPTDLFFVLDRMHSRPLLYQVQGIRKK